MKGWWGVVTLVVLVGCQPGGDEVAPPAPVGDVDLPVSEEIPEFVPFEEGPVLLNTEEVRDAMRRHAPRDLPRSGTPVEVVLWIQINEDGRVVDRKVRSSSGYNTADYAATLVVATMRFRPAQNEGRPVTSWAQMPVRFWRR